MGGQPDPTALAELVIGLLEALGRTHDAVLEGATLAVAAEVERLDLVLTELPSLLDDGFEQIGRGFGETQLGESIADIEDVVEDEAEIIDRCGIGGHLLSQFR